VNGARVGVDLRGSTVLVVRVDSGQSPAAITSIGKYAEGQTLPQNMLANALVTIGIPDHQTQTRVIELPPVSAELRPAAARFETTAALLDPDSSFAVTVIPLVYPSSENDPTQWLGMAVRRASLEQFAGRLFGEIAVDSPPEFLARGAALGLGYLNFCEAITDGSISVCDLSADYTFICFIRNGSLAGTASLRALPEKAEGDAPLKQWISELETLVRYRASVGSMAPSPPMLVFAGKRAEEIVSMPSIFTMPISAAKLLSAYQLPQSGEIDFGTDWLVALGLAVNGLALCGDR